MIAQSIYIFDICICWYPKGGQCIEIGHSVSLPAGRTPDKVASVSLSGMYKFLNTLRKGCAGERIGTRCLYPGRTRPLKGASLVVGDVSQSMQREKLKTPLV